MAPAISIVMRSHNDDRHIGRTLESLARQRCPRSFEIVSIDDGSTDRTRGIIASYPEIRHVEPPAGPYVPGRTLNAAVKACRGEVVETADSHPVAHLLARKRQRRSRQNLRLDAELAERKRAVPDHVFGPSPLVERKTADHLGDLHDSTRFPAASSAPRR